VTKKFANTKKSRTFATAIVNHSSLMHK